MRVTKDLLKLDAKVDALREERERYKKVEFDKARDEFAEAVDKKLLGKCFIWKRNANKEKDYWDYIKFIDRDESGCLRSVSIPYLIDKGWGTVSFSDDFISTRSLKDLKPISEEKFQKKLAEAFDIILSASKRADNGNT